MADQYEASMFGLDSPYWKDKYGWDFQRDERYPEKLDDIQENRLLAEGLNMAGITPDMDLGDIRKKYKSEFKGISNEEIHSFLDDVFTKSGIDTGFTYGDANSMFRKFLNVQGILREPDKKDWPTIDIKRWRDPPASIDPAVWDEKMRRDGDVVETIEWETPGAVRKMAKGGLLSGAAIVGEAGPELVIGNAEVVPLPDSFYDAQDTLRHERWLREEWVPDASYQELFESGWIEEAEERAEKERRDKRSQNKWDAIRRVRQYEAIANRLGT